MPKKVFSFEEFKIYRKVWKASNLAPNTVIAERLRSTVRYGKLRRRAETSKRSKPFKIYRKVWKGHDKLQVREALLPRLRSTVRYGKKNLGLHGSATNNPIIDTFQGRIPRSVLARHYTDYSLENLKAIYDRANLKVLGDDAL